MERGGDVGRWVGGGVEGGRQPVCLGRKRRDWDEEIKQKED